MSNFRRSAVLSAAVLSACASGDLVALTGGRGVLPSSLSPSSPDSLSGAPSALVSNAATPSAAPIPTPLRFLIVRRGLRFDNLTPSTDFLNLTPWIDLRTGFESSPGASYSVRVGVFFRIDNVQDYLLGRPGAVTMHVTLQGPKDAYLGAGDSGGFDATKEAPRYPYGAVGGLTVGSVSIIRFGLDGSKATYAKILVEEADNKHAVLSWALQSRPGVRSLDSNTSESAYVVDSDPTPSPTPVPTPTPNPQLASLRFGNFRPGGSETLGLLTVSVKACGGRDFIVRDWHIRTKWFDVFGEVPPESGERAGSFAISQVGTGVRCTEDEFESVSPTFLWFGQDDYTKPAVAVHVGHQQSLPSGEAPPDNDPGWISPASLSLPAEEFRIIVRKTRSPLPSQYALIRWDNEVVRTAYQTATGSRVLE